MADDALINSRAGRTYEFGRVLGRGETNERAGSCVECIVTCEDSWSLAQISVIELLAQENKLLEAVLPRAKRTAGNYAALFLADEGKPTQGRFYWPGLAAFAAKQVVEGIDYADKNVGALVAQVRAMAGISLYYLLKGNFWVFVEITAWKIFYRDNGPELFFHCIARRNVENYNAKAKALMQTLPWAAGENIDLKRSIEKRLYTLNLPNFKWSRLELDDSRGALAEMGNCKATPYLRAGFQRLREFETSSNSRVKATSAYQAAWQFLNHEQTLHLQAMIYDHADFQFAWDNNDLGRNINALLPITGARDPELVFNANSQITSQIASDELGPAGLNNDQVSVKMTLEDGKLYDSGKRMVYVRRILDQYQFLMQGKHRAYMVRQLRIIERLKDAT